MSERELITAVICQAALDYFSNPKKVKGKNTRNKLHKMELVRFWKDDARTWFRSKSQKYGSFIWYCGLIDLDPEYILRKIKKA